MTLKLLYVLVLVFLSACSTIPEKQLKAEDPMNRSYAQRVDDDHWCQHKNSVSYWISCMTDRGYANARFE